MNKCVNNTVDTGISGTVPEFSCPVCDLAMLTGTSSDVDELSDLDDEFGDIGYKSAMALLDTHLPKNGVSPDPLADDVPAPSSDHGNNLRHIFAEIAHSLSLRT